MCSFVLRFLKLKNLKFGAHWVHVVKILSKNATQCKKCWCKNVIASCGVNVLISTINLFILYTNITSVTNRPHKNKQKQYEVLFVARFGLPRVGLRFIILFGNFISRRLVIGCRPLGEGCCIHVESLAVKNQEPEHGVIKLLRNFGNCLLGATAKHNVTQNLNIRSCILWNLSRGRSCGGHERRLVCKKSLGSYSAFSVGPYLASDFLCLETITFSAWTLNLWRVINRL